ncbi:MAG: hypothetical protein R6U15_01010 [Candidatus Izemoplasmatales bacterium]
MNKKTIDELTNEHIDILNKFENLGMNKLARDIWCSYYNKYRYENNSLDNNCIDPIAYNKANNEIKNIYINLLK